MSQRAEVVDPQGSVPPDPDRGHDRGPDHGPGPAGGAGGAAYADRALGWLLLLGGLVGGLAAFTLAVEKIKLLTDPSYVPSCSINPVLSCGSVMATDQASLLGFPNPLIGIAAFPVLVVTGALVLARVRLPRWWWLGLQAGATVGLVFVLWLIDQSLYSIGALCPYCMVVWGVVVPVFWYVTLRNLSSGVLGERARASSVTALLRDAHALVLLLALVVVVGLVGVRFWDYWSTLL